MTPDAFRTLALKLPDATERAHQAHPDFRREGKVFATLGYPGPDWAMVKVAPEEQAVLIAADPDVFSPAAGAWGRSGSTLVRLDAAHPREIARALKSAWERAAPAPRRSR